MENEPLLTEEQIRTMRGDLGTIPVTPSQPATNNKPMFDAEEPSFSPNTTNQMSMVTPAAPTTPPSVDDLIAQESSKQKLWWIIGGVGGVIVLGAIGYFAVYPMLSGSPTETTSPEPTTPAQPIVAEPTTPVMPEPVMPAAAVSPFSIAPSENKPISLSENPDTQEITAAISAVAADAKAGMTLLTISGPKASPFSFSRLINSIAPATPDITKANLLFNDDLTAFVFTDTTGNWPGYIGTLKQNFSSADLRTWFTGLERAKLQSFFLTTAGPFAPFKTGTINNKYQDRYAAGKTAGASFSYIMLPEQNRVIVSTSFAGLKEAMRLMGL